MGDVVKFYLITDWVHWITITSSLFTRSIKTLISCKVVIIHQYNRIMELNYGDRFQMNNSGIK